MGESDFDVIKGGMMAVSKFELYHGIVLAQMVRHPKINVKLISRDENQHWAFYDVMDNQDEYVVYMKYASKPANVESKRRYNFTFTPQDISRIKQEMQGNKKILVCLVCGNEEVCLLMKEDLDELELWGIENNRNLAVTWVKNSKLTVKSGGRELSHKIARDRLRSFKWK